MLSATIFVSKNVTLAFDKASMPLGVSTKSEITIVSTK